ncbi:hypothetical protein ABW45_11660 [Stenotrophomonas maltophilia]|nr:hypothetical protein ABW45_11660 [Stenotrophomonas maltophilia]
MARQIIDTSPPTGTPAPTAFNMVNAMTAELYPLATGALQKTGGVLSGDLSIQKNVISSSFLSPNGQVGYKVLVNISDTVDGGYTIQRIANGTWSDCLKINSDKSVALSGAALIGGALQANSSIVSASNGIVSDGAGSGFQMKDRQDFAQTWAWFASGAELNCWNSTSGAIMRVSRNGVVTASSFNPASSADVKDFIEGYAGDACAELDRLVVIEYQYRPEFIDSPIRYVGLLAENVADVHPSASNAESILESQVEVERLVDVQVPVPVEQTVEVLTPVENFDPEKPEYTRAAVTITTTVMETRQELRKVLEPRQIRKPRDVDMMQILALNTRAHQQKSSRIRDLEQDVVELRTAVDELRAALAELRGSEP